MKSSFKIGDFTIGNDRTFIIAELLQIIMEVLIML